MQLAPDLFLTYCTNIHPANGWQAVKATLDQYALGLKARLSPDASFGIGLRLSGVESRELLEADHLARFKADLDEKDMYVFTINGFPYGPFHKQPVKDQVHAPDWRTTERVDYTRRLVRILAELLPEDMHGGISTNPLSYKPWLGHVDEATWTLMTGHVVDVAEAMVQVRRTQGKHLHLDIEPEPDGLLETSVELVGWYRDRLLPMGSRELAKRLGVSKEQAEAYLRDHVQVCWDTCHVAVAFEEPAAVLERYRALGMKVGRIQVSSALKLMLPASGARTHLKQALEPFAESTYLHQVVQQNRDGSRRQYPDLDVALPSIDDPDATEWRIHFHVPIFIENYGSFQSTQDGILDAFALLGQQPFTHHLEIETYTWDVLPPHLKQPLDASIRREYEWVLHYFSSESRSQEK